MSTALEAEPLLAAPDFLSSVTSQSAYLSKGIAHGRGKDCHWYVVDPARHPLHVWRQAPGSSYPDSALRLEAAVFTNGPMMGRRLAFGGKVTRSVVLVNVALSTALGGALAWGLVRRSGHPHEGNRPRQAGLVVASCALGAAAGYRRCFTGWSSCGGVYGRSENVHEASSFDGEGPRHAWLGRFGEAPDSYAIGDGDIPPAVVEGVGGLIRLVRDGRVVDAAPGGAERDRDFRELSDKVGVVAWGLAPGGPLVVLGSSTLSAAEAAGLLQAIGVRDAVATDQRRSAMMGHGRTSMLPSLSLPRQSIQQYGLYCRSA